MLNYKNGSPKYQCLHFYTMNNVIVHAIEYHPYRPHMRMLWYKRCSKCMLWSAILELIAPSELHVWQQLLGRDGQ